uniref:Uncharacterized protein n=1 Tax=Anguilla anguilla TaxID=7936 RepID=A0A0E9XKC4_ANGAN
MEVVIPVFLCCGIWNLSNENQNRVFFPFFWSCHLKKKC